MRISVLNIEKYTETLETKSGKLSITFSQFIREKKKTILRFYKDYTIILLHVDRV